MKKVFGTNYKQKEIVLVPFPYSEHKDEIIKRSGIVESKYFKHFFI